MIIVFGFLCVNYGYLAGKRSGYSAPGPKSSKSPEEIVLQTAGEVWNEFLKVEGLQANDKNIVNENIHRIQDMMYANLYIKKHGKL